MENSLVIRKTRSCSRLLPEPAASTRRALSAGTTGTTDARVRQSLQSLRLSLALNANPVPRAAARVANASRARFLAQVKGFRSYNQLLGSAPALSALCDRVLALSRRRYSLFPLMLERVDGALRALAASEREFFCEADACMQYEQKVRELDHLKANIEQCVKRSVGYVRAELYKCQRTSVLQAYADLPCTDRGTSVGSFCGQRGAQPLHTPVEYQVLVTLLQRDMAALQVGCDAQHRIPCAAEISAQTADALVLCKQVREASGVALWLDAAATLRRVRETRFALESLESRLMRSLLQYQSATNVLLDIVQESERTATSLRAKTADLRARAAARPPRDVLEEERALVQFVDVAKDEQQREMDVRGPECSSHELAQLAAFRERLSRIEPQATPVWALAWAPSTRILGRSQRDRTDKPPDEPARAA